MAKEKEWKFKGGNYFMVSAGAVKAVAQQTNSAEAVLAYFVLCERKQKETVGTTGGANIVATALRISRPQAAKLIDSLKTVSWGENAVQRAIVSPKDWNDSKQGKAIPEKKGKFDFAALPPLGDLDYYLDNDFLNNPDGRFTTGLERLMKVPKKERLDAILLYLQLVESYSLSEHGGIDPRIISTPWTKAGQIEIARYGIANEDIRYFMACEPSKSITLDVGLSNCIFDGDFKRLENAFMNLLSIGIMSEVPTVFTQNPREAGYDVLYAVDVDSKYRNIMDVARSTLESVGLDSNLLSDETSGGKNHKVFVSTGSDAMVSGVFRLKHLNNSSYYLRDKFNDEKRIEQFKTALDELSYQEDKPSQDFQFNIFECQTAT